MATYRDLIEGLKLLAKYDGEDSHIGGADHDIIWASDSEDISDEDKQRLDELGWHWDGDSDCWSHFC